MSKRQPKHPQSRRPPSAPPASSKRGWIIAVVVVIAGGVLYAVSRPGGKPAPPVNGATAALNPTSPPSPASSVAAASVTNALPSMEAAQSVVVTQDLDYGGQRPGLEEVLRDLDRRHQPDDGTGRTFAILEAFNGEAQADGKTRVSLRLSTEEAGVGEIVFRKTGQALWKTRITNATHQPSFTGGALTILFDNGDGKSFTVDGSTGPATIFDAMLKEPGLPVSQMWPEGAVRDLSFIYSACGCPIHVKCRREGLRTIRTEAATQVIFPDDPVAIQIISRLMGW